MKRNIAPFMIFAFFLLSFTRPDKEFKVFQFPKDQIPRIDGEFSDWDVVPECYSIGLDELMDIEYGLGTDLDPKDYDITVKVGWVKGLNKLFFYLEITDDYWDFSDPGLSQDIFELVMDGDISGGSLYRAWSGLYRCIV